MILVTGASGNVGNNLVRRLVQLGKPVRAMVSDVDKALIRLSDIESKVEIVKGDVTRRETLTDWMKGVETVVHLAAIAIEKHGHTYESINTQGTINVVEVAKEAGVKRFINMCQNAATADSPYRFLRSKGIAQAYVTRSGLEWTAFRPSVIWGPQDEFANVQARLIQLTPIIFPVVGDGKALFQPVYVGDVVDSFIQSIDDPSTIGQEYELGGPEILTYEQILDRVFKAMGTHRFKIHVPIVLLRPAVAIIQSVMPHPPVSTTLLDLLAVPNTVTENALISKFKIMPKAFMPENLTYMKDFTPGTTMGKFFGHATEESAVQEIPTESK